MIYQVIDTANNMKGLELIGGDPNHHYFLRWALMQNYMYHPAYRLNRKACGFIQGQSDKPMWTLIEFWGKEYEPFVNWLNENAEENIAELVKLGIFEKN